MKIEYFFNDHARWSLLWESPNAAGTFIIACLPLLWCLLLMEHAGRTSDLFKGRRCLLVLLLVVALTFLLAKTYSRGALVALVAELFVFGLLSWGVKGPSNWRGPAAIASLQMGTLAAAAWVVGFLQRVDPGHMAADASVTNRLEYWRHGIGLLTIRPWSGLGFRESGLAYMQWAQPVDSELRVSGMVNSYLELAVEFGLPVVCIGLGVTVMVGGRSCHRALCSDQIDGKVALAIAGASVWSGWMVSNLFSSMWQFPTLWILPVCSFVLMAVWRTWSFEELWRWSAGGALSAALAASLALWAANRVAAESELNVSRGDDAIWRIQKRADTKPQERKALYVFVDKKLLGPFPAKEVRRLALALDPGWTIAYCENGDILSRPPLEDDALALILGRQSFGLDAAFARNWSSAVFIHPDPRMLLAPLPAEAEYIVSEGDAPFFRSFLEARADEAKTIEAKTPAGVDFLALWPRIAVEQLDGGPGR